MNHTNQPLATLSCKLNKKKTVVLACKQFENNNIFKTKKALIYPGGSFFYQLAKSLQKNKIKFISLATYLKNHQGDAFLLSNEGQGSNEISTKLKPLICFSFESPLFAKSYYNKLKYYVSTFAFVFGWSGCKKFIKKPLRNKFRVLHWPFVNSKITKRPNNKKRKFLVLINSNKNVIQKNIHPFFHFILSKLFIYCCKIFSNWSIIFNARELHTLRAKSIKYFSLFPEFNLFGSGWESFFPQNSKPFKLIYKGHIAYTDKINTLAKYKFCLCYENCKFPGYITEKIFDCLIAKTIPIYDGCPCISRKIPKNLFINRRMFKNDDDLNSYIRTLSQTQQNRILKSGQLFLKSKRIKAFLEKNLVEKFTSIILNA